MRAVAPLVVIALVIAVNSGCSTVAPSAAKALTKDGQASEPTTACTYSAGRATQTFASPAKPVGLAVLAAMDDLHIQNVQTRNDASMRIIEGTTSDNRRASVMLRPQIKGSTRLTARIGLFGDEPFSRALMERIGIRLGTLPPGPIPAEAPSSPAPNPFINFKRSVGDHSEMLRNMADAPFGTSGAP